MDKLTYIKTNGKQYPIKCDNLVLQEIQNRFGSIKSFEMKLIGLEEEKNQDGTTKYDSEGKEILKRVEPSVEAINIVLPLMVNEGLEIEAEQYHKEFEHMEEKEVIRAVSVPYIKLSEILHEELCRCFSTKK